MGYNHISLVQDRVPTPEGEDAPGNLGTGRQMFARATLDAPLGRFGIKGGRLTVNGTLQDTSVEDPYTHRKRGFSAFHDWELSATFRQDLGRFAYGAEYTGNPAEPYYRRNEIDIPNARDPYVSVFGEYRPSKSTSLILRVDNVFDVPGQRFRTFFKPDRSHPVPYLYEKRSRNQHPAVSITLKRSFG